MKQYAINHTVACDPDDFHVVSCSGTFDFAPIFEQSILTILPASLFAILGLLRVPWLCWRKPKSRYDGRLALKAVTALILLGLQLSLCVLWARHPEPRLSTSLPASSMSLCATVIICALVVLEHRNSVKPGGLTMLYLFLSILFDIAQVRTLFLERGYYTTIAAVLSAVTGVKIFLMLLEDRDKRSSLSKPYNEYPAEALSGPITFSFFLWLGNLFRTGWRKLLTIDDLARLDTHLASEPLTRRLESSWATRKRPEHRFTLLWAVARCFKMELLAVAIPRLSLIGFTYAQPFLINRAVSLLSSPDSMRTRNIGYGLIGATFFIYVGIAITTVHYQHRCYRVITMFRGAMVGLIYQHTLVLPEGANHEDSAVTLMSTDIESIIEALRLVNEIWARLIEVAIGIWLLARQLGAPCVVPILLVLLCTVGQGWIAMQIGDSQKLWNEAVQKRVSATSSMLSKIRAVKVMGLSDVLSTTLQVLRLRELYFCSRFMTKILYINIFATLPVTWSPILTFVAFTIQSVVRDEPALGTAQAFTALSIISLVTAPALALLATIPVSAAAMGPFTRLQEFFLKPTLTKATATETQRRCSISSQNDDDAGPTETIELVPLRPKHGCVKEEDAVVLRDCSIRPSPKSDNVLSKVSLNIAQGTFTCVIGPVGSGKTIFLKTVLGELQPSDGTLSVSSGLISYCGQTSWLKNATVQQNICNLTQHQTLDERWYKSILHACALSHDLSLMPDGDSTLIGTGGIKLSGGQKARVALARALYARNRLVLLDDVLSALDARTSEMVISHVFGKTGLLRRMRATTLLVTNSAHVLPLADSIILIDSTSRRMRQGSFEELRGLGMVDNSVLRNAEEQAESVTGDQSATKSDSPAISEQTKIDYTRSVGDWSVYKYYAESIGGPLLLALLFLSITSAFASNFSQVLLKFWTEDNGNKLSLYLTVYVLLAAASMIFMAATIWVILLKILPKSAARLHAILLGAVMGAPFSFFAATDSGETLNRFSQDMSLIDLQLPTGLATFCMYAANCLVIGALIATGSGYMAISLPFVFLALYIIQNVYLRTSRQLRLLDLEAKSPLYSLFSETLEGLISIRAFGWQKDSKDVLAERLNTSQRPYYMLFCVQRWLNLVLDLLVAGLAVCLIALAVTLRNSTSPGLLGIALNNILNFNTNLSGLIVAWTTFEISLGAIARVKAFSSDTPSERSPDKAVVPPADWPTQGVIEFRNVSAEHAKDKIAVNNVSMSIVPGQRIGICGRTGSGKSSLLGTILGLLDITQGTIMIDGVDIDSLPRETIRQRLLAVPQDACVLPGTVRFNIDPFKRVSDEGIITALTKVRLWEAIEERGGLEGDLSEHPLSQGQLQLFCLARALIGDTKIVLLDEATSNVDAENDRIIQLVLREELKDKVVIVVAHRIDTILDSDMIAVMDNGRLIEFDSPADLLARDSVFKKLHDS